jgi:tetratricopeptide (TPR) repeat protein
MVSLRKYPILTQQFIMKRTVQSIICKRLILCLVCLSGGWSVIAAQNLKGLSPQDRLRLSSANENFRAEFYVPALEDYGRLSRDNPGLPTLKFFYGRTLCHLSRFEDALATLEEVWQADSLSHKDLRFYLGWMKFRYGQLDESRGLLSRYLTTLPRRLRKDHEATVMLSQIAVANTLMANPYRAPLTGLDFINTEYDESGASLTADGYTMVFTASRPENKGGKQDPNTGAYFQDIYITYKDSNTGVWEDPFLLPGQVNTEGHDAALSISADGNVLFTFSSAKGGGDIMYSRVKKNGEWREPQPLEGGVNSSYFESSASLSADSKLLFYISERRARGAKGMGDVWVASRKKRYEYENPQPIPVLNTWLDENSVFIHPNGEILYFSSNRGESMGGYDIFYSRKKGSSWTAPINMGSPINSVGDEIYFYVTPDGEKAYLTSRRPESNGYSYDIFEVDLSAYVYPDPELPGRSDESVTVPSAPTVSIVKGKIISREKAEPLSVMIQFFNEAGELVNEIESGDGGNYLTTLPESGNYTLLIEAEGFVPVRETFFMPRTEGKTEIVVKAYVLEKQ